MYTEPAINLHEICRLLVTSDEKRCKTSCRVQPACISLTPQPAHDLKWSQARLSGHHIIFPPIKCSSLKKLFLYRRLAGVKLPPTVWSASDWSQWKDLCELRSKVRFGIKRVVGGCSPCCCACIQGGGRSSSSYLPLLIEISITGNSTEMPQHARGQHTSN